MSDGLTAEQEAEWRYPWGWNERESRYWELLERERIRAEVAEARVAELQRAVIWMSGSADFAPGTEAYPRWCEIRDTLLAAPTTEAVTE